MRTKLHCLFFLLPFLSLAQQVVHGVLINAGDKEGIHVFNKTYQKYTITNEEGEFKIKARLNDTLVFTAIQYKLKTVVLTKKKLSEPKLLVNLEEQTNELDEVYIGYRLSGNLLEDSKHIKTKKDLGKDLSAPFKGLGDYDGVLPIDAQSPVVNEAISSIAPGADILGLIKLFIPEKKKVKIKEIPSLEFSREAIEWYYGENFFKETLNITSDIELFVQFCEKDVSIINALKERNELLLLSELVKKGEEFKKLMK